MPLYKAVAEKSFIRTEFDQNAGQSFDSQTAILFSTTESSKRGSLFNYIYDVDENGYSGIEVLRDSIIGINVSLGSQGSAWGDGTLATLLLNTVDAGVIDVFYELPIPASGSLYPTASLLARQASAGDIFFVSFLISGDVTVGSDGVNSLSYFSIFEI